MSRLTQYEMKNSGVEWIGKIPKGWEVHKAKHFIEITNGSDPLTEGETPVYGSGSNSFRTCGEYKEGPAVLVGRKGSIDKPRFVTDRYWNVDTAFDVKTTTDFNLRLYYYLATCFDYKFYMSQTTLPSMTQTNYRNMPLPVPPLAEQAAIAAYLDEKCGAIDEIIAEAKASIGEYKAWKSSVIFEAVTKGLNPDAEMVDSGVEWIGKMPKKWEIRKIKTLGTYRNGLTYTPDNLTDKENGTLVLRSSNIQNGKIHLEDNAYVSCPISEKMKVQANDILICSRNGSRKLIGKCALIPDEMDASFGAFMMIFRCVSPRYIYYILNSNVFSYYIGSFFTATINQLTSNAFGSMEIIFCPDPNEQQEIVDYLDRRCAKIDEIIAEKEALITALDAYKKSLIFETVTGKRRVCG